MMTTTILSIIIFCVLVSLHVGTETVLNGFAETKLGPKTWAWIISLAAITAIAYFVALTTTNVALVWVMYIVVIIVAICYISEVVRDVANFSDLVFFTLIMVALLLIMRKIGKVLALHFVITTIPWIVLIAGVMLPLIMLFIRAYRYDEEEDDGLAKTLAAICAIAALLGILLVLIFGIIFPGRCAAKNTVADATKAEILKDLTVRKVTEEDLDSRALVKFKSISDKLLVNSMAETDAARLEETGFSDALTFGFKAEKTETDKMFKEVEEEILRNPIYGVTVANSLRDKHIGGYKETIGDVNPWMAEMVEKHQKNGLAYWLEFREDGNTIYTTKEYRTYAVSLCILLEKFVVQDVQAYQTYENWCLNAAAKDNDREGIKASYQYKKDALILTYVGKDGSNLLTVGFNIHDKRPEFYPNPTPAPETTTTKPEPTTKPVPTTEPTTKPEPTTEPTTKPDPETTTKYNKDPKKSHNSGKNDNPGPGPDTNNGVGATKSKADKPSNSSNMDSYQEYKDAINELKEANTTTTTRQVADVANVDSNAAEADKPTPVTPPVTEIQGDKPAEQWDGPAD